MEGVKMHVLLSLPVFMENLTLADSAMNQLQTYMSEKNVNK